MKKILLLVLCGLHFGCTGPETGFTIQETFANGQAKTIIYQTNDNKNSYYEIRQDSLGRIEEITPYSDGQINGTQVYFRANLRVAALLSYQHGKREGFNYEFYEGQQMAFKGEAKEGKFSGSSIWFYENGRVQESGLRIQGKKRSEEHTSELQSRENLV